MGEKFSLDNNLELDTDVLLDLIEDCSKGFVSEHTSLSSSREDDSSSEDDGNNDNPNSNYLYNDSVVLTSKYPPKLVMLSGKSERL